MELADIFFFQTSSMLSFCLFATTFLSQGLEKAIAQKRCKMIWHLIGIIILIYSVLCDQEKAGQGTDDILENKNQQVSKLSMNTDVSGVLH